MKVHLSIGGSTACKAGARWLSSVITSTKGKRKVSCKSCRKSRAFREQS